MPWKSYLNWHWDISKLYILHLIEEVGQCRITFMNSKKPCTNIKILYGFRHRFVMIEHNHKFSKNKSFSYMWFHFLNWNWRRKKRGGDWSFNSRDIFSAGEMLVCISLKSTADLNRVTHCLPLLEGTTCDHMWVAPNHRQICSHIWKYIIGNSLCTVKTSE